MIFVRSHRINDFELCVDRASKVFGSPNTLVFCSIPHQGCLDSVEWNGGMEWNGNKLDTSDWFSPPYRPPLNKDHLLINTT